jgi:hypothetical protein
VADRQDHNGVDGQPQNLQDMLNRLEDRTQTQDEVSLGAMLEAVGRRSFGPVLLLCGLVPASPLSGIPGLPSVMAVLIFIVVAQILTGHHHFWLPESLLRRKVSRQKFCKAIRFLRVPARWIDRLLYPRLCFLTTGPAVYVIAAICALIALSMPPLELIPFANTTTGIAVSVFGLALVSHDGLLVVVGTIAFAASIYLGVSAVMAA